MLLAGFTQARLTIALVKQACRWQLRVASGNCHKRRICRRTIGTWRERFFGAIRLSRTRAAFAQFAPAALMDSDREASLEIPIADCFYRLQVQIAQACHTHLSASFRHACKSYWQLPLATFCHLLRFALATQPCRLHFEIPIAQSAFSLPLLARLISLI